MESRGESPSTPAGGVRRPRGADPLANRSHLAGEKPRHRSLDVEKQRKLGARNARATPAANDRVQAISVEASLREAVRLPCREKHARRDRVRLDHTDRHVGKQDRDVFRLIAPEVERVAMIAESDRTRGRQQGSAGGKNSLQVADGARQRACSRPRCRRRCRTASARNRSRRPPISQLIDSDPAISTPRYRSAENSPPDAAPIR